MTGTESSQGRGRARGCEGCIFIQVHMLSLAFQFKQAEAGAKDGGRERENEKEPPHPSLHYHLL